MTDASTRMIDDYARNAARRSGLPDPVRTDAEQELRSHLHEAALAHARTNAHPSPNEYDAVAAIHDLGTPEAVDATFFAPHRTGPLDAAWGRRVAAYAIDFILISGILAAAALPLAIALNPCDVEGLTECKVDAWYLAPCLNASYASTIQGPSDAVQQATLRVFLRGILPCAVSSAGLFTYFWILEGSLGRTLGKMALGLRTLREDGSRVGWARSLPRAILNTFPVFALIDWSVGMNTNRPRRLRLSDKASGTRVI